MKKLNSKIVAACVVAGIVAGSAWACFREKTYYELPMNEETGDVDYNTSDALYEELGLHYVDMGKDPAKFQAFYEDKHGRLWVFEAEQSFHLRRASASEME